MKIDYIINGQGYGELAQRLQAFGNNHHALRPFSMPTGRIVNGEMEHAGTFINALQPNGKYLPQQISNATSTLRKDDWILLDKTVISVAQPRLKLVSRLRAKGLQYTIPNGLGKTVLQSQTVSDISPAEISMNGVRESRKDRPVFDLVNLPLPIIHKDFEYYAREIAVSRNGGTPIDTTTAQLAARKVAEQIEALAIGNADPYSYGGGTIYGLINFPGRLTKVITSPTASGWTPQTLVSEVLAMRQDLKGQQHFGPFFLFLGTAWDAYLDEDYSDAKGDNTLRDRLAKIAEIEVLETLDYLADYSVVLVAATPEVIRQVIGMDITTLQWETHGGMQQHFKVMAIQIPQIREDFNGNTGIIHGEPA